MTRMYYFMLHLSIADILTALLTLFSEVVWTITSPNFYGGNLVCKGVKFLQMIGPYLSSYILAMTAIDRYQAICHPLSNQVWAGKKSKMMVLLAWVVSLALCIPQAVVFGTPPDDLLGCYAHFQPGWGVEAYVTWFSISNFFLPLLVLTYCYVQICIAIWKNFSGQRTPVVRLPRRMEQQQQQEEPSVNMATTVTITTPNWREERKQRKSLLVGNSHVCQDQLEEDEETKLPAAAAAADCVVGGELPQRPVVAAATTAEEEKESSPRQLLQPIHTTVVTSFRLVDPDAGISRAKLRSIQQTVVVILMYVACSTPFICVQLWTVYGQPSEGVLSSVAWLFWLLTLNSVVNPFIYLAFNRELRGPLLRLLRARKGTQNYSF